MLLFFDRERQYSTISLICEILKRKKVKLLETEKNNRMGKTRDHFKIIKDTKGTFHTKIGTIKDRNGMYIEEAEYIKNR